MTARIFALLTMLALAGCATTPEREALDDFNDSVGTVNKTVSNVRLIRSLVR